MSEKQAMKNREFREFGAAQMALYHAARKNLLKEMAEAIAAGADPLRPSADGYNAAQIALINNSAACAKRLLGMAGALDVLDEHGRDLCALAATAGSLDCVKLFYPAGGERRTKDPSSALAWAISSGESGLSCADFLMSDPQAHGPAKSFHGFTPLMAAARFGNAKLVAKLLPRGSASHESIGGETAMSQALDSGDEACISLIEAAVLRDLSPEPERSRPRAL